MPKLSEMFPSKYVRAADIPEGQTRTVTITDCPMESVGQGRDAEDKWVLYTQEFGDKGLILNKTNAQAISDLCGEDTDDWPGQRITLFRTLVQFESKMVDAIRVHPKKPVDRKPAAGKDRPPVVETHEAEAEAAASANDDEASF